MTDWPGKLAEQLEGPLGMDSSSRAQGSGGPVSVGPEGEGRPQVQGSWQELGGPGGAGAGFQARRTELQRPLGGILISASQRVVWPNM